MPWVRRPTSHQPYWLFAVIGVAAACVGLLIGYAQWGVTAAVVNVVEKELAKTQADIKDLEKRMNTLESLLLDERVENRPTQRGDGALKNSEAEASKNRFLDKTSKKLWKAGYRL